MIFFGLIRVLVSSIGVTSMATSGPSTWRAAASTASPYSAASEFDGMTERNHWIT